MDLRHGLSLVLSAAAPAALLAGLWLGCAGQSGPVLGSVDAAAPPCSFAGDYAAAKRYMNGVLTEVRSRSKMIQHGIDTNMSPTSKKRWESCGLFHGTERVHGLLESTCPTRDVPISEVRATAFTTFVECDDQMPN